MKERVKEQRTVDYKNYDAITMRRNYEKTLWGEIIRRNYLKKLSGEIMTPNYQEKL